MKISHNIHEGITGLSRYIITTFKLVQAVA